MCAQHQQQEEPPHLLSSQIREVLANFKKKALTFYRERRGLAELIVGVVAGLVSGLLLSLVKLKWEPREAALLVLPASLFAGLLETLSCPFLFSFIVTTIGELRIRLNARLLLRTASCFFVASLASVMVALFATSIIRPGQWSKIVQCQNSGVKGEESRIVSGGFDIFSYFITGRRLRTPSDTLLDMTRLTSLSNQETFGVETFFSNASRMPDQQWHIEQQPQNCPSLCAVALFAVLIGIVAQGAAGEGGDEILAFFDSLFKVCRIIVDSLICRLLPIGLFLSTVSATAVNLGPTLSNISPVFALSCLLNLCNSLILLPLILHFATNKKQREEAGLPIVFIGRLSRVLSVAMITGSPRATLAILIVSLEQDGLIDQGIVCLAVCVGTLFTTGATATNHIVGVLSVSQSMENASLGIFGYLSTAASSLALSTSAMSSHSSSFKMTLSSAVSALGADQITLDCVLERSWLWITWRCCCLADIVGLCLVSASLQLRLRGSYEVKLEDERASVVSVARDFRSGRYRAYEQP